MNIKIKEVSTPEELDILKNRSGEYQGFEYKFSNEYLNKLKLSLNEPHALHLIAEDSPENKFAGYIATSEKLHPGYLNIYDIFIENEYQKQGIASQLFQAIAKHAKDRNLKGIYVHAEYANKPVQNWYKKLGFELVENKNWLEGISMKLEFSNQQDNH
jgi:ribosomal protein S18 acetylase RimI-like enzyme